MSISNLIQISLLQLPSAEGGDGSDDEIPCTPAFAASELGLNPVLPKRRKPMLTEDELLLGDDNAEMEEAKPVSGVVAIPTSSSEDEDVDDNGLQSSNRTPLRELECGVIAGSLVTISKDDMRWKQPTEGLPEVTEIPVGGSLVPLSEVTEIPVGGSLVPLSEVETVTASDETSKCLAALGDGGTAGLSYSTLWQLSNYREHEDNTNFYVPALASIISPVKVCITCSLVPRP